MCRGTTRRTEARRALELEVEDTELVTEANGGPGQGRTEPGPREERLPLRLPHAPSARSAGRGVTTAARGGGGGVRQAGDAGARRGHSPLLPGTGPVAWTVTALTRRHCTASVGETRPRDGADGAMTKSGPRKRKVRTVCICQHTAGGERTMFAERLCVLQIFPPRLRNGASRTDGRAGTQVGESCQLCARPTVGGLCHPDANPA